MLYTSLRTNDWIFTLQLNLAGSPELANDETVTPLASNVFDVLGVTQTGKINQEQFIRGYQFASPLQLFDRTRSSPFQGAKENQLFKNCSVLKRENRSSHIKPTEICGKIEVLILSYIYKKYSNKIHFDQHLEDHDRIFDSFPPPTPYSRE